MRRLLLAVLPALIPLLATAQPSLRVAGPPVAVTRAESGPFTAPRWSPAGDRIAFTRPGYAGLWVIQPDGDGLRAVSDAPGAGFGFSWSPDGSTLLARVAREAEGRRSHAVSLIDPLGGDVRYLTDFRARMPSLPEWAPGTSDVVLAGREGLERFASGLPETARKGGRADRFVLLREGRPVVADAEHLVQEPLNLFGEQTLLNLATAPDGRRVAFEVLGGHAWVADPDGGNPVDLGPGHRPQWSPDGTWVVLMVTEDDGERFTASDLVAVRADGSETVRLTDTPDRLEMNPSWSPDGRRVAYDDLRDGVIYLLPLAR